MNYTIHHPNPTTPTTQFAQLLRLTDLNIFAWRNTWYWPTYVVNWHIGENRTTTFENRCFIKFLQWHQKGTESISFRFRQTVSMITIPLRRRHNGRLKSPASRLFTQPFIRAQMKENIKAPRHWPLCGELSGDRPVTRKMFPFHDVIMLINRGRQFIAYLSLLMFHRYSSIYSANVAYCLGAGDIYNKCC